MNLQVWTQWSVLLTAPHTFFTWNPEAHIFSGSLTPAQSLLFPLFSSLDITASLDVVFFSTCTHSLGALSQRMTWSPFICWWPSNLHSIFNATLGLQTRMYIYLLETSAWMPTISKTCHVHDRAPDCPSLTSPTPNLPPAGQICNLAITHYFSPQAQKGYVTCLNSESQWVRNDLLYKK